MTHELTTESKITVASEYHIIISVNHEVWQ